MPIFPLSFLCHGTEGSFQRLTFVSPRPSPLSPSLRSADKPLSPGLQASVAQPTAVSRCPLSPMGPLASRWSGLHCTLPEFHSMFTLLQEVSALIACEKLIARNSGPSEAASTSLAAASLLASVISSFGKIASLQIHVCRK